LVLEFVVEFIFLIDLRKRVIFAIKIIPDFEEPALAWGWNETYILFVCGVS